MKRSLLFVVVALFILGIVAYGRAPDKTSMVDYVENYAYGYGKANMKQGFQSAKRAAIDAAKANLLEEVYFSKLKSRFVRITSFEIANKEWKIEGLMQVDQIEIKKFVEEGIVRAKVRVSIRG